jgi:hypothetical protein
MALDKSPVLNVKKVESVLAVFQHIESFLAFLFFIAPGFISLRAYEMRRTGEGRRVNEALVDVVVYSFVSDILWIPVFEAVSYVPNLLVRTIGFVLSALGFLVTAIYVGRGWYSVQAKLARSGAIADPIAKPWDKFFGGVGREKQLGIVLTLPDGRKLGGRYGPGFASSYPADEQLHVGETWRIGQTSGIFEERVEGSLGFIIDMKDVLTVEFFDWAEVERTSRNTEGQNE